MKAKIYNYSTWISNTHPKQLLAEYKLKLETAGFDIVNIIDHHFKPFGYTALFLLSESHCAIHTFPEEEKTYIELSSCVKKQFDSFIHSLEL